MNVLKAVALACVAVIVGCTDGPTAPDRSLPIIELGSGIYPDIAGDHVVWQRHNGGPILRLDLGSERLDTLAEADATSPVDLPTVHGDRTAWIEHADSGSSVVLTTPEGSRERVTDGSAHDRFPRLSGELLVWERRDGGDGDIYVRDLRTTSQGRIAPSTDLQIEPRVDGHRVVWTQHTPGEAGRTNYLVRLFDAETGGVRTLTASDSSHGTPDLSGDVVVWVGPGGDIEYVELGGPELAEPSRVDTRASFPAVSVPWIVWVNREDDDNIWAHHIRSGETFPITSNARLKSSPAISGDRVVWIELHPERWKVMSTTLE